MNSLSKESLEPEMDFERLGLQAWINWMGLARDSESLEAIGRWRLKAQNIGAIFSHIGKSLFAPPSENHKDNPITYMKPQVDIEMHHLASHWGVQPAPFWPRCAPYAVCVTHDIDRILATFQRIKGRSGIQALTTLLTDLMTSFRPYRDKNPYFNFKRILALESDMSIQSASYVLFEKRRLLDALKKREIQHFLGVYSPEEIFPELIVYENAGNEVGLHGSFDSWKSGAHLNQERARLKTGGIQSIHGIRNHYLQFDLELTPKAQKKSGFLYDSSIGFNSISGFRSGTCFPYSLNGMMELPFQLMDSSLKCQFDDYRRAQEAAFNVLDEVRMVGGVLVLNWHTQFLNFEHFPESTRLLQALIKRAKKDGAWIDLPRNLINWWNSRNHA